MHLKKKEPQTQSKNDEIYSDQTILLGKLTCCSINCFTLIAWPYCSRHNALYFHSFHLNAIRQRYYFYTWLIFYFKVVFITLRYKYAAFKRICRAFTLHWVSLYPLTQVFGLTWYVLRTPKNQSSVGDVTITHHRNRTGNGDSIYNQDND